MLYRPLITKKGDAAGLKALPRDQKEIATGNELLYDQYCRAK